MKDLAAERRKNVATAEGRGLRIESTISRGAAEDSFATTWLIRLGTNNHGRQPWLHSYAASRLNPTHSRNLL
jgi:hypothetical protein